MPLKPLETECLEGLAFVIPARIPAAQVMEVGGLATHEFAEIATTFFLGKLHKLFSKPGYRLRGLF